MAMSGSSTPGPLNLQLWFGDVLVAELSGAFPHQGTLLSDYRPVVNPQHGPPAQRVYEFLRFCDEWHRRHSEDHMSADAGEFDSYTDVTRSEAWWVRAPDGAALRMDGSPFFAGD